MLIDGWQRENIEREIMARQGQKGVTPEVALKEILESLSEDESYRIYGDLKQCVVDALEKQIPKKPELIGDGYADGELVYDTWICPNCRTYYEIDFDDYLYCPHCGQKIER